MGTIIHSKIAANGHTLYKLLLDQNEALVLKNSVRNVRMFAADLCLTETNMIKKGKDGATQHFEIPLELRSRRMRHLEEVSYKMIETDTRVFYIYLLDKKKGL